jgi:hypothetical protein
MPQGCAMREGHAEMIEWTFTVGNLLTIIAMGGGAFAAFVSLRTKAESTAKTAEAAAAKAAEVEREFHKFQLEVATKYATTSAIAEVEQRVVDAINRLGDRLDKFLTRGRLPRSDGEG